MTELSKLTIENVRNLSKSNVESFVNQINDKVEAGLLDAIEVEMFFKFLEKMSEGLKAKIRDKAIDEYDFSKIGNELVKGNFIIQKAEAGVSYDFSADERWLELKAKCDEADKARKEREEFLKRIPTDKPLEILDPETGELIKTYAPLRKSTTILKYTIR